MKNKHILFIVCTFLFCFSDTNADENSGVVFNGYLYTDLGLLHTVRRTGKDEAVFAGMSVLSLDLKNTNHTFGKVEGLCDIMIPYGMTINRFTPADTDTSVHDKNLEQLIVLYSFGKAQLLLDLRKLYLSFYLPFADVTIGRQIVNFGTGTAFSPIDVFSFVELTDINLRRRGTDIFSIRIPFADLAGIDVMAQMPFLNETYSVAAKLYATLSDFDFSCIGIFRDNSHSENTAENEAVAGLTFKGDIALIGIHGEAVGHYLADSRNIYLEGMLGADYSINKKWFFAAEYLYKQYNWQNCVWGEHNAFGSVRYAINDLMNISTRLLYDFQRESILGTIQWYYNILQNVNTTAYVQGTDTAGGQFLLYALRVQVNF